VNYVFFPLALLFSSQWNFSLLVGLCWAGFYKPSCMNLTPGLTPAILSVPTAFLTLAPQFFLLLPFRAFIIPAFFFLFASNSARPFWSRSLVSPFFSTGFDFHNIDLFFFPPDFSVEVLSTWTPRLSLNSAFSFLTPSRLHSFSPAPGNRLLSVIQFLPFFEISSFRHPPVVLACFFAIEVRPLLHFYLLILPPPSVAVGSLFQSHIFCRSKPAVLLSRFLQFFCAPNHIRTVPYFRVFFS